MRITRQPFPSRSTSKAGPLGVFAIGLAVSICLWITGCQLPEVVKEPVPAIDSPSIGAWLHPGGAVATKAAAPHPETPGFLKLNHHHHLSEEGLECDACHEIGSRGHPTAPDHDTCSLCHDIDIDVPGEDCLLCHVLSPENIAAEAYEEIEVNYFPESGGFAFDHTPYADDASACASCHGAVANSVSTTDDLRGDHSTLFAGVRQAGGDTSNCALCHTDMDPNTAPQSHKRPEFMQAHGKYSFENPTLCMSCHSQKQCQTCHSGTKPQSHHRSEWRRSHGKVGHFDEQKCTMCHTEDSCMTCHQQEMPRDHTNFFRRRSHGKIASWNRDRCLVCHKQDYCQSCHIGAAPSITSQGFHRPGTPCLVCHSPASNVRPLRRHGPLPEDSCLNCHRFE